MTGAAAVAQLISIGSILLLARLYTPQDFGVLSVYLSVLTIITVGASLCFESAIPLPKDDETATHILILATNILLVLTIVIAVIVYFFGKDLLGIIHSQAMTPYIWLLPVGFAVSGFYQLLSYWAIRKKDFLVIAQTRISLSGGRALTQLAMGWLQTGAVGLVIGHITGQVVGAINFCFLFLRYSRKRILSFSASDIHKAASRYSRFPKFFAPAALLYSAGLNLPSLILASFYGLGIAGYFLLAQRMIGIPLTVVGDSIADVYYAEAADIMRNDPLRLKSLFFRFARKQFLMGILPAALLITLGEKGLVLILGESWRTTGSYVAILGLMFFTRFVTAPLSTTLSVLEKQHLFLVVQVILLAGSLSSLLISGVLGLTHIQAVKVFSVTMCLAYIAEFCIQATSVLMAASKYREAPQPYQTFELLEHDDG